MAATAAVTVARLGGIAAFWGRGGDDAAGREMHKALAGAGCRRQSISSVCRWPIVGVRGSRRFRRRASDRQFSRATFRSRPTGCRSAKLEPRPLFLPIRAGCRERSRCSRPRAQTRVPTVLDADVADAERVRDAASADRSRRLLGARAVRLCRLDRRRGAGQGSPTSAVRVAAVTRGADGVTWLANHVVHRQPAYAVDAIDTTGAGDVFHGAYAFAIGVRLEADDAMSFAAAAAALKCTRPGGRAGIPTLEDCLAFQRNGQ